ncbi:unnamed protein product [Sphenostylis stenocarpa]|uniref:Uncharacterized protein n=1 Tax=Sphenostylis stenocarpa TaxID=92480 RepID=A0AA86TGR1_9FABA|nr:unnamed protein product [Sphenostylis stenocarpa]
MGLIRLKPKYIHCISRRFIRAFLRDGSAKKCWVTKIKERKKETTYAHHIPPSKLCSKPTP